MTNYTDSGNLRNEDISTLIYRVLTSEKFDGGEHLDLSERKVTILQVIIRNYLETGEPVGSRTISKYSDLNLSSATIRNEMADLVIFQNNINNRTKNFKKFLDAL